MPQWNKILRRQIFSNKLEERVYAKMILFQGGSFSESPGYPFIWTMKFREIAFCLIWIQIICKFSNKCGF